MERGFITNALSWQARSSAAHRWRFGGIDQMLGVVEEYLPTDSTSWRLTNSGRGGW